MLKQKLIDTKSVLSSHKKSVIITICLIAALVGCASYLHTVVQAQGTTDSGLAQGSYMEEPVVRSDIIVGVTEMGSATLISTPISFSFDTTVLEVLVRPGEFVSQGDVLATIDPQAFDELYEETQNALEQAKLKLQEASLTASSQNLKAEQDYTSSITTGNNAQSVYDLGIAELESGYNTILAEISSLETQLVTSDQQIAAQQTIITNANTDAQSKITQELTNYSTGMGLSAVISEADLKALYDAIDQSDLTALTPDELKVLTSYNNILAINDTLKQTTDTANTEISKLQSERTQAAADLTKNYTERDTYAASMELKKIELLNTYNTSVLNYNNAQAEYNNSVSTTDNTVDTAQATVDELQLEVDMLTAIATDGSVTAPIDGYIMTIASEGDVVRADTEMVTIADSNMVYVSVSIPQEDIADIEIGMPVNIIFDAYEDFIIPSEVDSISITPAAGMQSSVNYTVTMICYMSAFEDIVIYQGMTADVTFVEKQVEDVLVISNKCLIVEDGVQYVKRLNANGEIEQVEVETGFSDGFDVEIISGISEGDTVIIESAVAQNAS